jgi:phosphohistidine phosphatase
VKLYFLRHATASDYAASDAERPLTKEGEKEASLAGTALNELGVKPDHIFTSPLLRAQQTARIAAQAMWFSGEVELMDELQNGETTKDLVRALKPHAGAKEILLVGHMPSLSEHIAELIGAGDASGLVLGKGAIACVKLDDLATGTGRLRWFMGQKQFRVVAHSHRS